MDGIEMEIDRFDSSRVREGGKVHRWEGGVMECMEFSLCLSGSDG